MAAAQNVLRTIVSMSGGEPFVPSGLGLPQHFAPGMFLARHVLNCEDVAQHGCSGLPGITTMKVTRKEEIDEMPGSAPPGLYPNWVEGPFNADRLDVGVVTMSPGVATPPHVHIGGQVLVVTHGLGFVEANGERQTVSPGDVVVCPPGESHVHGALGEGPFTHISVTTGGYTL
jgi:quercetin dioxygenase-like cupin family protein